MIQCRNLFTKTLQFCSIKLLLKATNVKIYGVKVCNFFRLRLGFQYFKFSCNYVVDKEIGGYKNSSQYFTKMLSISRPGPYQEQLLPTHPYLK